MKIGLISDTHSYIDDRILHHLKTCDEIWHAGDWGNFSIVEALEELAPVRGVYGNIDGHRIRAAFPGHERFTCEGMDVWITHIGGYPGKYDHRIRQLIRDNPPDIFICGHSHILKIIPDPRLDLLHLNPGAAGKSGFHQKRTMILMEILDKKITDLKVVDLGKRAAL